MASKGEIEARIAELEKMITQLKAENTKCLEFIEEQNLQKEFALYRNSKSEISIPRLKTDELRNEERNVRKDRERRPVKVRLP